MFCDICGKPNCVGYFCTIRHDIEFLAERISQAKVDRDPIKEHNARFEALKFYDKSIAQFDEYQN